MARGPKNALYITLDGGEYSYSSLGSKKKGLYFANKTKSHIFYSSSSPISNNGTFQKSVFWAPLL